MLMPQKSHHWLSWGQVGWVEGPGNCVPWEHTTAPASKCLSGAFGVAFILMSEPAHGGLSQERSCAGWETHLVTPEAGWRVRGGALLGTWTPVGSGVGQGRSLVRTGVQQAGTQMSLEALGTWVFLLRWSQTGQGGVRMGEGMGRGPRIW